MKKYILSCLFILGGIVGSIMQAQMVTNQLEEIYHQKNNHKNCLEIASVLLLFSRDPQEIPLIPQHQVLGNGMHQLTFVFNNTLARQKLLRRASTCPEYGYTVKFDGHDKTVSLVIMYDPTKIEVRYDKYTDLDLRRGYIIRFFDRVMLNHLKNKESYILQTAAISVYRPIRLLV